MRIGTLAKPARIAGWILLAFVAIATVGPIEWRPQTFLGPDLERFLAYVLTALLLTVGYRGRKRSVILVVVAAAIVLEFAQLFVAGRDARVIDSAIKVGGAVCGAALGALAVWLGERKNGRRGPP